MFYSMSIVVITQKRQTKLDVYIWSGYVWQIDCQPTFGWFWSTLLCDSTSQPKPQLEPIFLHLKVQRRNHSAVLSSHRSTINKEFASVHVYVSEICTTRRRFIDISAELRIIQLPIFMLHILYIVHQSYCSISFRIYSKALSSHLSTMTFLHFNFGTPHKKKSSWCKW